MLKNIFAAAATLALLSAPQAGFAQDEASSEDAAATPQAPRTYDKLNFDAAEDRDNIWVLDLSNGERVMIRLMPNWAPNHVERIKTLTRQGFYDGIIFHRVIDGFMAQSGDPTGTGQGGSELPDLKEEFNPMPHLRGTVSMARAASEDSANSQFFIVFYPRFSLDKRYTNFGRVISNMGGVDAIVRGEPPANPTRIVQASIASDDKPVPVVRQTAPRPTDISAEMLSAPISE
ncbi:Peptidyl-prolyl cis-trans isomerase [Altererythrobacter epoxidivorans]|uniref:Peptidyl-prolyl cis-trans isomerase n=1 Tax=Altererythrobacter epoxidivorans TaxID=361183 RepID=A0A0M3TA90_9SPHN|nr:peptidylprolyl isomerase [Altererythrobacter epoxidivorans]ALE16356.1 Peptidyl-prolyl cis-trans isomerase [Altererythrobacter epoxidivorans]